MKVQAIVRRKTQDLVQDAAEDLLRREIPGLSRVRRAELWTFEVEADDPTGRMRGVLEDTALVVNPNVHRYSMHGWDDPPEAGMRLLVRVTDRVDAKGAQVLRAIRERLGRRDVTAAARSILWSVDLDTRDAAAAQEAGRTMLGDERGAGVLANPHAQDAELEVIPA